MPTPLPKTPSILIAVVLLAGSSGLIDAVVYMRHGHVFAYAMTGNLVLLGIAASTHDTLEVLRHFAPLLGFVAGVLIGKTLLRYRRALAVPVMHALQITVLFLAGAFAGRLPSEALVVSMAVSGGMIITVIRRVGEVPFNITFMTGNLRAVLEGAFDTVLPPDKADAKHGASQLTITGLTCAGFLAGAAVGALSAQRFQDRSFWIAGLLFLAAGFLLRRTKTSET